VIPTELLASALPDKLTPAAFSEALIRSSPATVLITGAGVIEVSFIKTLVVCPT
jgi:hypothetical protein